MKIATPLLVAAALAATAASIAPAWADPGDGRRGDWRGGGRSDVGGAGWRGAQGGQGWRGGQGQQDGGGGGRYPRDNGAYPRDGGRFGDGMPDGGRGFRDPDRSGNGGGEPPYAPRRAGPLRGGSSEAVQGVREGLRPMGQVLNSIRNRQPGRQLDAGMETWNDGRPAYRVLWEAENGRRIDYVVDARTGAILSVEGR